MISVTPLRPISHLGVCDRVPPSPLNVGTTFHRTDYTQTNPFTSHRVASIGCTAGYQPCREQNGSQIKSQLISENENTEKNINYTLSPIHTSKYVYYHQPTCHHRRRRRCGRGRHLAPRNEQSARSQPHGPNVRRLVSVQNAPFDDKTSTYVSFFLIFVCKLKRFLDAINCIFMPK